MDIFEAPPEVIPEGLDIFQVGKAYSIADAARLAGTTSATARRWLQGYQQPGHQMIPVFGEYREPGDTHPLTVSFVELIEIVVVARFRKGAPGQQALTLDRLRRAYLFARDQLGVLYPFASLKLREFGGHVLHEFEQKEPGAGALVLDLHGQMLLPLLVREEVEHNLDFKGMFAERWFPKGREVPLVVDPRIAGGRMTLVGHGITVQTLQNRWRTGEPIRLIARDYGIKPALVEEILQQVA